MSSGSGFVVVVFLSVFVKVLFVDAGEDIDVVGMFVAIVGGDDGSVSGCDGDITADDVMMTKVVTLTHSEDGDSDGESVVTVVVSGSSRCGLKPNDP